MNVRPSLANIASRGRLASHLARRTLFSRYRESVLGALWAVLTPLVLLAIYSFVFSQVFKARWATDSGEEVSFGLAIFSGLLIFNFLNEVLVFSAAVIVANSNLIKRSSVNSAVLPQSVVISALMTVGLSLIPFVVWFVWAEGMPPATAALLPVVLLPLLVLALGVSFAVSAISVYFRDMNHLVLLFTSVMLFMSPIFYPESAIPERFLGVLILNPIRIPLTQSKRVLFASQAPEWRVLGVYFLVALSVFVLGRWIFSKLERGFADVI